MVKFFKTDGGLSCFALNKDCSVIAVAGRSVFKVYSIENGIHDEKCNLKYGRSANFGALDIVWSPVNDDWIASAATNGMVVVWDLNKQSRNKQHLVYQDHKRAVNRICFHGHDVNLLLSGAQGGQMKLFDMRRETAVGTFSSTESVRDIQFSPFVYHNFAAAFDNGSVQIWDIRNPHRYEKQFQAHSGPVFCADYHPEERNWLATSGRDKFIKVWENSVKVRSTHIMQAIAPVARVRWRPQSKCQLSSCALLMDFSVTVWDIRRPFVPFALFEGHKDVVAGVHWANSQSFYTASKDSNFAVFDMGDGTHPIDRANPVAVAVNAVTGTLSLACSEPPSARPASAVPLSNLFYPRLDRNDKFCIDSSYLTEFSSALDDADISPSWFITCAKQFTFNSEALGECCDHNAAVARSIGRHQVATTWEMLKVIYSDFAMAPPPPPPPPTVGIESPPQNTQNEKDAETASDGKSSTKPTTDPKESSSGVSDSESDQTETEADDVMLSQIASGLGQQDDFFSDQNEFMSFEDSPEYRIDMRQDWTLPREAFPLRHELSEDLFMLMSSAGYESPTNPGSSEDNEPPTPAPAPTVNQIRPEILNSPSFASSMAPLDMTPLVLDMVNFYADKGDIQMAVTVILALGDRFKHLLDEIVEEHWLSSYLDLLYRHELYTVASAVIKCTSHPEISRLSHKSTTFLAGCSNCGRTLRSNMTFCEKHSCLLQHVCAVCHLPVRGRYMWCQGCCHGGHIEHIKEWFNRSTECPTGCGHNCQFL